MPIKVTSIILFHAGADEVVLDLPRRISCSSLRSHSCTFCTKVPIKTVADEVVLSLKFQILGAVRNGVHMVM